MSFSELRKDGLEKIRAAKSFLVNLMALFVWAREQGFGVFFQNGGIT
jgi:hypothetical protein